jgi:MazG family protein
MAQQNVAPEPDALPGVAPSPPVFSDSTQLASRAGELFAQSAKLMEHLRSPNGCPWDRGQTPATIRRYTLEETYEVLDAIERESPADLCEELGDLLLQVLFYAQMASEAGQFGIEDVVEGLNRKLIRRHPHVFGEEASAAAGNRATASNAPITDADGVKLKWDQIKQAEKLARGTVLGAEGAPPGRVPGRMDGVLRSQPALLEAHKLGSAAHKCGFDWPDARGLLAKIREEADEVEAEMELAAPDGEASKALQLEVGDLLFVTASLARHLHTDAETALRDANAKFRSRFAAMEHMEHVEAKDAPNEAKPLEMRSLDELEVLWQRAKRLEKESSSIPSGSRNKAGVKP